jgi:hypothetical protein
VLSTCQRGGRLFHSLDSSTHDRFADLRVYNLGRFIESIQEK